MKSISLHFFVVYPSCFAIT